MKLNPDELKVVSFETAGASRGACSTMLPTITSETTEGTFCEICR